MATIRWKRADSYEEANNYIGANGEVVVDLAENRLWVYDGANAYVSAAFTQQDGRYIPPYVWAGETKGYLGGGLARGVPQPLSHVPHGTVQTVSFVSDTNATDIAEMASPFLHGQQIVNHDASAAYWTSGQIQKTPYASDECVQVDYSSGAPTSSYINNVAEPWSSAENGYYNSDGHIHKFPFAITLPGIAAPYNWNADASLPSGVRAVKLSSTAQSETYGYKMMGYGSPLYRGTVAKFPFSSDTNYEDVGELHNDPDARTYGAGASVGDKGLAMGGETKAGQKSSFCDAIAFSSDTLSTLDRTLSGTRYKHCGLSSTSAFYSVGGISSPTGGNADYNHQFDILKSPAASSVNFSEIGDLADGHVQSSTLGAND